MGISKEQLIIPVYLNEKIVLDMLAIIEDGFSTKNILEKLLKIQLNAEISGETMEGDSGNSKSEKVHTNVSLFSKFRIALEKNNLLFCKAGNEIDIEKCKTGDFVVVKHFCNTCG